MNELNQTIGGGVSVTPESHFILESGIVCQYKGNCSDEGVFTCGKCKNNTGKKSHFEPDDRPHYIPYVPYTPYPYPYPSVPIKPYRPYTPIRWCKYD